MISLGSVFPSFKKKAVVSLEHGKEFYDLSSDEHINNSMWLVMFWWPKDFTFVCPTELIEFNRFHQEFVNRNTLLLGASTDSEYSHLAWRQFNPQLKDIKYPMLADTSKSLASELGILTQEEKVAYRATFICDPQGVVKWISVYDLNVGRNVQEVLRVLDALQTDELCPCNWQKGEKTLSS